MKDFKESMNEWCAECTAGAAPCKQCSNCHVSEIEKNGDSFKIGRPTGFVDKKEK